MIFNLWVDSLAISIVYLFLTFFEMRWVQKENRPLKDLIRNALMVFMSCLVGFFILQQLHPIFIQMEGGLSETHAPVFTGDPDF